MNPANNQLIINTLKSNPLTNDFTQDELKALISGSDIQNLETGIYLVREGDKTNEMYIILSGQVCLEMHDQEHHSQNVIGYLTAGDIVGEFAFLDGSSRYCGVKTTENTAVLKISRAKIIQGTAGKQIIDHLSVNIALTLSKKIKKINEKYVEKLKEQINHLNHVVNFGRFFVIIITCLYFSQIFTYFLIEHESWLDVRSTGFTWTYLLALLLPILYFAIRSGNPPATFGINTKNLARSLMESAVIIAILGTLIYYYAGYNYHKLTQIFISPVAFSYLLSSFIQEFITRGVVQTTLVQLLPQKNPFLPIIITSFLFSSPHLQMGLPTVAFSCLGGILFGYIYKHQKNIFGVSLVHFILGWMVLKSLA